MFYYFEVPRGKTRENITSSYMRMLEWVTITCIPKFDLGLALYTSICIFNFNSRKRQRVEKKLFLTCCQFYPQGW